MLFLFLFYPVFLLQCVLARRSLDVSLYDICLAFAALHSHCFVGCDRFGSLLGLSGLVFCWLIFFYWNVCWAAGFWKLLSKHFLFPWQRTIVIFDAQNCEIIFI